MCNPWWNHFLLVRFTPLFYCLGHSNANVCGFCSNFAGQTLRIRNLAYSSVTMTRPDPMEFLLRSRIANATATATVCHRAKFFNCNNYTAISQMFNNAAPASASASVPFSIFQFQLQPLQNFWLHSGKLLIAISALYFFQHLLLRWVGVGVVKVGAKRVCALWGGGGSCRWARN